MYSKKALKLLEGMNFGDKIKVITSKTEYEGILMPSHDFSDPNTIVLKLDNGYNVGVLIDDDTRVVLVEKKKSRKVERKLRGFSEDKPRVSLVTVGGTITSKVDYETGGVTSLMSPEELLELVPELFERVNIVDIRNPFNRMSESMEFEDYENLVKEVEKELNKSDGVIVTHGTDTLHFTAAALSFAFHRSSKPIVLTGAQRSSDRPSSDAAVNLICSAIAASSDIAETMVCMHATVNDDYCYLLRGAKVRKMHSSRRDAFRPINDKPLARVFPDGRIEKIQETKNREDRKVKAVNGFDKRVALVKAYPGSDPDLIEFYLSKGVKGIVVEATGLGQVPLHTAEKKYSWLPAVKKAIKEGVVVCFAPQTLYGALNPFVYSEARVFKEAGVVFCKDMLPETAYIKLSWLLAHEKSTEEVKRKMLVNYVGELKEKLNIDEFLV